MSRAVSLESFLGEIQSLAAKGFDLRAVNEYLSATVLEPESVARFVTYRSDRYTRNLIHKTNSFELLAIGWNVGQSAPVHGHEGERCWARVEEGTLRFTNYRELSASPLRIEQLGAPLNGSRGHLDGPADIHAVENPASFNQKALSLHLYSFPFPECDIYDLAAGVKRRVRLSYDTVEGEPVHA